MASKKFILTVGLVSLLVSAALAQRNDASYDWRDSSKIPTKRLPQHSEFVNNNYPYPAKPRSMWELGFAAGGSRIFGDVGSAWDLGGAITLRKALSHTFSIRAGYFGSKNQGDPTGYQKRIQNRIRGNNPTPRVGNLYRPYQTEIHSLAGDFIVSLNPNSRYRGNPKMDWYVLFGMDLVAARTFLRILPGEVRPTGGAGDPYRHYDNAYRIFYGQGLRNTKSGLLGTFGGFEDPVTKRKAWALMGGYSVGAGAAIKLNKRFNIGIEQRFTMVPYDYLDGTKTPGSGNDIISFSSARLNINIGSSARKVEPLWWINGNNYVYNELNRPTHFKIPAPILPDADGDGVTDQFDMEPNTPAGVPVDVRGVARDTDGDGVPDYKDKELLTPSKCFPVDADGVGNCPEPQCCKELRDMIANMPGGGKTTENNGCPGLAALPSVQFKTGSAVLGKDAQNLLRTAATQIKANPSCRVRVTGHGTSTKAAQQLSWDRVNAVIRYMVEKQGISEDRFIFTYGMEDGDPNTVDLMGTTDSGPNRVPAPHPNLKRK